MRRSVPANFTGVVEYLVQDGTAAEEIVATATKRHCDVIVLGTHGRSGVMRILVGSVAEAVLRTGGLPCADGQAKSPRAGNRIASHPVGGRRAELGRRRLSSRSAPFQVRWRPR